MNTHLTMIKKGSGALVLFLCLGKVLYAQDNVSTASVGIGTKNPTATLDINGNLRIQDLENSKKRSPSIYQQLRAVVADEEGNLFTLNAPEYEKEAIVIPIIREGSVRLTKTNTFTIKDIFKGLRIRGKWDRSSNLAEIKLIIVNSIDGGQPSVFDFRFFKSKLFLIHASNGDSAKEMPGQTAEKKRRDPGFTELTLNDEFSDTIKVKVIDGNNIMIKKINDSYPKTIRLKYFITRYETLPWEYKNTSY